MRIAILGHMARDEAAADRLNGHQLHFIGLWQNPGLAQKAKASGGKFYTVKSLKKPEPIADIVQTIKPDLFLTHFDDALAAGVVDAIQKRVDNKRMPPVLIPSPNQAASRIEWDKFFLRQLIDEIDSSYNPINFMIEADDPKQKLKLEAAFKEFIKLDLEVVIKPRNLAGGKGVKVMGKSKHFRTYDEALHYAATVLDNPDQSGCEVQERWFGPEFTLQIFTDGKTMVRPPATYDYPYRKDGDTGPGTGGMGCFTMSNGLLPFLTRADYDQAMKLMTKILKKLRALNLDYKGVLYPTFFKTKQGLKLVEINARGGDPELVNVLDLLAPGVDYAEVLQQIALGKLRPDSVRFQAKASAMIYLVAPQYGFGVNSVIKYRLDPAAVEASDVKIRFFASEKASGRNTYQTVGTSRTIGLSALGPTPWAARQRILSAIENGFGKPLPLDFRREVGDQNYIKNLNRL